MCMYIYIRNKHIHINTKVDTRIYMPTGKHTMITTNTNIETNTHIVNLIDANAHTIAT